VAPVQVWQDAANNGPLRLVSIAFGQFLCRAPTSSQYKMAARRQTETMFRALFLILAALVPIGLVYAFGAWTLLALFGVTAATLLFSTRKARGAEATQGGRLTGYHTTTTANF
jgi:type III secretory pathway component EscV